MTTVQENIWDGTLNGKPEIGAKARRTKITTEDDVRLFSEITGDFNPLHYDGKLANASVFGGLIVQGGVTSGVLNAIVAQDLPGPGTVFLEVSWRFVKAVKVGDKITGEVEIKNVRPDKPICELNTRVFNVNNEDCLVGHATVYVAPLKTLSVAGQTGNGET